MNYIWQHKHWPRFSYDSSKLSALAYQYAKQAAQLSGRLSQTDDGDSIAAQLDLMGIQGVRVVDFMRNYMDDHSKRKSLGFFLLGSSFY